MSVAATVPVSGFSRRFCPASLTRRMRSTVGLKSKPKNVPLRPGVNAVVPTAVAAPVVGTSVRIRLELTSA